MHQVKVIEVRDRATLIVMVATKVKNSPLLRLCGFDRDCDPVIINKLNGSFEAGIDQWTFQNDRTKEAVKHIIENFDSLQDRDVVDIEYILGEVTQPKVSQWPRGGEEVG